MPYGEDQDTSGGRLGPWPALDIEEVDCAAAASSESWCASWQQAFVIQMHSHCREKILRGQFPAILGHRAGNRRGLERVSPC